MEFCRVSELTVSPYLLESRVLISPVTAVFITCLELEASLFCPQAVKSAAVAKSVTDTILFLCNFLPPEILLNLSNLILLAFSLIKLTKSNQQLSF